MKNFTLSFISGISLFLILLSISLLAQAQETETCEDKTASPFFFVKSNDGTVDQLPLKKTSAEVLISGVIAVTVKQTYCNIGQKPLEAIYIFPASTKAAVHFMQMELGGRILKAEIREKEQAREEYEQAKQEGKTTSLLEQQRPNVFQMNVANILPGDTIQIEMQYTELLSPLGGVYQFVYPTVVGPRYAELSHEGDSSWIEIPYTHQGEAPTYDFDISTTINAGMPIHEISSPSHANLEIKFISDNTVNCFLPESEKKSGNKDFVLQYVLSGEGLESGILLYEGEKENFFLTMIQPPKTPSAGDIPPREYVFIMDVSGSMNGFPISVSKILLTDLISNLNTGDKFNVICFAGGTQSLSNVSLDATPENIDKAIATINNKEGGGGTNMLLALKKALSLPGTENYSRTFVIVTDGYVSIEQEAFDLIRNNLSEANFFAFGIGSSVNRYLIEGIAHVGMGEPFVILNGEEAVVEAERFRKYIESPVLTNIEMKYDNFNVYDVEPLTIPDVFAERPIITFGKWTGTPQGSVEIKGLNGTSNFFQRLQIINYPPSPENAALKYLWARHVIQRLDDYSGASDAENNEGLKAIITELGLKYNLLTRYTSFIAIDSLIRNNGDSLTTVTQPLPLPEGISDLAVGGSTGGYATTMALSNDASRSFEQEQEQARSYIDRIYPNPARSDFKVWLHIDAQDVPANKQVYFFDNTGHIINIVEIENIVDEFIKVSFKQEDFGLLPSGIYRIALVLDGKPVSSKNIFISAK